MFIFCGMDKLLSYLKARHATQAEFAASVGITQAALSRMLAGKITPSLTTAVRIERATDGAVPASSWVTDLREGDAA